MNVNGVQGGHVVLGRAQQLLAGLLALGFKMTVAPQRTTLMVWQTK